MREKNGMDVISTLKCDALLGNQGRRKLGN